MLDHYLTTKTLSNNFESFHHYWIVDNIVIVVIVIVCYCGSSSWVRVSNLNWITCAIIVLRYFAENVIDLIHFRLRLVRVPKYSMDILCRIIRYLFKMLKIPLWWFMTSRARMKIEKTTNVEWRIQILPYCSW